jgi:hypothetical protein
VAVGPDRVRLGRIAHDHVKLGMKKSLFILGFLVAATVAAAGARATLYVAVGSTYAYGSIGDARRSGNTLEYIGCTVTGSTSSRYATCYGSDAMGHYGSCYSYDEKVIRAAETVGSDSSLSFSWSGAGCRSISITNDSRYSPRQP